MLSTPRNSTQAQLRDCPLARFVPAASTSGNLAQNNRADIDRKKYVALINLMYWHPRQRGDVLDFASSLIDTDEDDASLIGTVHFNEVSTLGKMDENWMANYHAQKLGNQANQLGAVAANDGTAIKQCSMFFFGATLHAKIDGSCKSQTVMKRTLDARVTETGNRYNLVTGNLFNWFGDQKLDWACGCYEPLFQVPGQEWASHIVHRPSGHTDPIPAKYKITTDYELDGNWGDYIAAFTFNDTKAWCHRMFRKGRGPHSVNMWRGENESMQLTAVNVVNTITTIASSNVAEPAAPEQSFQKPIKDKRKANAEAGVQKMVEKKAGNIAARRVRVKRTVQVA